MKTYLTLFLLLTAHLLSGNDSIKSKQYIFPGFQKGIVYYKEESGSKLFLNYNMITDELLFLDDKDKKVAIHDYDKIDYVAIGLRRFIPLDYDFGEVISETNEVALVLKRYTKVSGSSRNKVNKLLDRNMVLPDNITLKTDSTYYLVRLVKPEGIKKGVFKGLSLSQDKVVDASHHGFLKVYSNYKDVIEQFIIDEEIDFKKPADIIRLNAFCCDL